MSEENLRIPMILRHPAGIPPGRLENRICTYDFYPSMIEYLRLPGDLTTHPGRSYSKLIGGSQDKRRFAQWDDVTFHEYENTRAVHTGRYKLVQRFPNGPHELYDHFSDPDETINLFARGEYADIRSFLQTRIESHFREYCCAQYDLWNGGVSKAGRSIPEVEMR